MLSIILTSRVNGNPDSNIDKLIQSTIDCMLPGEECEFLIKYDDDDPAKFNSEHFHKYPIPVKCHYWSRGEGRHSIHHAHEYLFSRINDKTKIVLVGSDDFIHTRKGFITDALDVASKNKYCMITGIGEAMWYHDGIEQQVQAGPLPEFYEHCPNWESMDIGEYCQVIRRRYHRLHLTSPIFTRDFLEAAQNFGWQANADSWAAILELIYFDRFNDKLWKRIPAWYARTGGGSSGGVPPFYNNMEVASAHDDMDHAYIRLLRRQIQNIHLNMKCDG